MNPFSPRHPASPQYFVNRKVILQRFESQLLTSAKTRPPKPDNVAILGEWGIGKTSVLQKLEEL
ncbi:ATP-binding protein, partial [Patescibacteria group bacterium]|nr:ATP-binding protein [Patescibacteria group bacterium]